MTEKKTDAWMPLWIGAYLADTQHLTRDEHGAYFLLMMAYWRNKGPLADDDKRLAAIVKASPKEWKALRETLAEFFTVADGTWRQKRIDAELIGANERSIKAASKAQAAANARWGNAKSNAPSMPQALPEHMQDECPTSHTNTLGIGKPTLVAKDETELSAENARTNPLAGDVCKAMKAAGMASVNPSSPKLASVLAAGITLPELTQAAADAVAQGKGFAYALAMAEGRRRDALQPAKPQPTTRQPIETFAERDARIGRERWEQMTGRTHPDNMARAPAATGFVVDVSTPKLEFQQ